MASASQAAQQQEEDQLEANKAFQGVQPLNEMDHKMIRSLTYLQAVVEQKKIPLVTQERDSTA